MPEAVWIAWENQVRNKSLSSRLRAELHVVRSKRTRLVRYAICSYRSLMVIWNRRPSAVFAPNPSIVLAYLLLILRSVFRYALVIDAHYAGIVAPSGYALFQKALDYLNRRADLVIVTNERHCKDIEAIGGRSLVCEDPLPDIGKYARAASEESKNVVFICSFDIDEPYADVFRAAGLQLVAPFDEPIVQKRHPGLDAGRHAGSIQPAQQGREVCSLVVVQESVNRIAGNYEATIEYILSVLNVHSLWRDPLDFVRRNEHRIENGLRGFFLAEAA